ncbi:MAG: hypothetical protein HY870_10495 [Chloroflexi bacterium]|nr:hypothetical protein [Chloroflexota bacterium]
MDLGSLFNTLINAPGIGGAIAITVLSGAIVFYIFLARWIVRGASTRGAKPKR